MSPVTDASWSPAGGDDTYQCPAAALSATEKATVLDELLATRPDLRGLAETHATRLMSNEDRSVVAGDVADALRGRAIDELNSRAGYRPGRGYVHPVVAADQILDE